MIDVTHLEYSADIDIGAIDLFIEHFKLDW